MIYFDIVKVSHLFPFSFVFALSARNFLNLNHTRERWRHSSGIWSCLIISATLRSIAHHTGRFTLLKVLLEESFVNSEPACPLLLLHFIKREAKIPHALLLTIFCVLWLILSCRFCDRSCTKNGQLRFDLSTIFIRLFLIFLLFWDLLKGFIRIKKSHVVTIIAQADKSASLLSDSLHIFSLFFLGFFFLSCKVGNDRIFRLENFYMANCLWFKLRKFLFIDLFDLSKILLLFGLALVSLFMARCELSLEMFQSLVRNARITIFKVNLDEGIRRCWG